MKQGKRRRQNKPSIKVTSEGDLAKADFNGLAALLFGIRRQKEPGGTGGRGAIFEALDANMASSRPPLDPETGRGITHDIWIPLEEQLPENDKMVEVWNTGIDQVEDAYFDTAEKRWLSPNPLTVYMFGEITHWREKQAVAGSAEQEG